MATAKQVTVGRLPVLMLTLANNASYWRTGSALANGASVQFQGSELVWEYYAGSGIQLQVLHTFGEGDGYYEAGPADYPKLVTLMSEMVPLAVQTRRRARLGVLLQLGGRRAAVGQRDGAGDRSGGAHQRVSRDQEPAVPRPTHTTRCRCSRPARRPAWP